MLLRAHALRIPQQAKESPLEGPVNLELSVGDRITITGKSGSGKSTLLRCLAMLDARAMGTIEYRGTKVWGEAVPEFRREVIFVRQAPPQFAMTVEQSLRHAFTFSGCKHAYEESSTRTLMDELLLPSTILTRPLPQVSGGEAQRLSLLRALLLSPTVLLLDEVTSGLDEDSVSCVVQTLARWFAAGGRAGIAITHGSEVWAASNRHIRIESGKTFEDEAV